MRSSSLDANVATAENPFFFQYFYCFPLPGLQRAHCSHLLSLSFSLSHAHPSPRPQLPETEGLRLLLHRWVPPCLPSRHLLLQLSHFNTSTLYGGKKQKRTPACGGTQRPAAQSATSAGSDGFALARVWVTSQRRSTCWWLTRSRKAVCKKAPMRARRK